MVAPLEGEKEQGDKIIYDCLYDIADKAGINCLDVFVAHSCDVLSD